jgi:hypothetical protein
MAWNINETTQYPTTGRAAWMRASEVHETRGVNGLSVYSGSGGRS